MVRREILITGSVSLVGLLGLYYLVNKLGFKQRLTKRDVTGVVEKADEIMVVKKCS